MSQQMIDAFVKRYGAKEVYGNDSQYLAMLGAFTVGWNACLEATQQPLAPDACPVCFGDKYLLHNDGLMHPCPACNGTGKRR